MGQGTTDTALQQLHSAAQSGEWLCLKNVHLVAAWLPTLEKAVHFLGAAAPGFRLFLTAEPHPGIPPTLLENSHNVAFEAPPGIKRSMRRAYEGWSAGYLAAGGVGRARLMFSLAWVHAVMAERQAYVPEVWCMGGWLGGCFWYVFGCMYHQQQCVYPTFQSTHSTTPNHTLQCTPPNQHRDGRRGMTLHLQTSKQQLMWWNAWWVTAMGAAVVYHWMCYWGCWGRLCMGRVLTDVQTNR